MRLFRPVWENRDNPDKALRAVSRIKSQKKLIKTSATMWTTGITTA